jgi:hypothetical protein
MLRAYRFTVIHASQRFPHKTEQLILSRNLEQALLLTVSSSMGTPAEQELPRSMSHAKRPWLSCNLRQPVVSLLRSAISFIMCEKNQAHCTQMRMYLPQCSRSRNHLNARQLFKFVFICSTRKQAIFVFNELQSICVFILLHEKPATRAT